MCGFYDYTVILTYCSVLSATAGIFVSFAGNGHPYIGAMFLMVCGLCDTFDGRIARSKKNREDQAVAFGVQIDSLSDLLAFGVLPVCIGMALYERDLFEAAHLGGKPSVLFHVPYGILIAISALFILCALIRLAYFNVTVDETQNEALGSKKHYYGLPVTSTALIFPTFLLLRYVLHVNMSFVYYLLLLVVAVLFVLKFKLKKPGTTAIYLMVLAGAIEFIAVMIMKLAR